MTSCDTRATQVLNLCQEPCIKVPRRIAVLGADNGELLDESCAPPLTSILPDHKKLGCAAARELERLMAGRTPKNSKSFLVRPVKVVERESSVTATPTARILSRAPDSIRKNAPKAIKVADAVKELGISRRLAGLRFQQFSGETINEAVTRHRLDAVKKLFATADRPVKVISQSCGYTDLAFLETLFKRRFGSTMRDWHRQNHAWLRQKRRPSRTSPRSIPATRPLFDYQHPSRTSPRSIPAIQPLFDYQRPSRISPIAPAYNQLMYSPFSRNSPSSNQHPHPMHR